MDVIVCVLLVLFLLSVVRYASTGDIKLPPGPPGLPFVGNIRDLNGQEVWRKANGWGKKFGGLVYLNVLGTPILFVEQGQVAHDLLHKRSPIYSDRQHMTMAGELCGLDGLVPLTRGGRFKKDRKLLDQAFSPTAIKQWRPALTSEVLTLLKKLAQRPEHFVEHLNRLAGSVILRAVYGYQVQADEDSLIHAAQEVMRISSVALESGWLVDFFTPLKWIPGTKWRRLAKKWRMSVNHWISLPYDTFKTLPDDDEKYYSFCNLVLAKYGQGTPDLELEERLKWVASSLYGAGLDTTVITLSQFIMAMVLNPIIQRKAQEEIDRVVGKHRLPDLEDRDGLPLIDCILKETLRWGTPVPLTPPHRLTQADSYNNMRFPEGSLFTANIWSMLHDAKVYPDPLEFRPERFLDSEPPSASSDPYTYAFGFGRRSLDGMHFADQTLWLTMTCVLACFDVQPFVDKAGVTILPEVAFEGGVFRYPKPFKCRIALRSKNALSLMQELR